MEISAEVEDLKVSEEGMVALAVEATADEVEGVDMEELVVLEAAGQEAAVTEVALEVGSVDQRVVDTEAEAAHTAVDSVDAQGY